MRRRSRLKNGCAIKALLMMPAALAVGIVLAGPARAQSTIPSTNNQVYLGNLTNYPDGNPFTVGEGNAVNVGGPAAAIYGGSAQNWTLTNLGVVTASGGGEDAIVFEGGGTVNNSSYYVTLGGWHYGTISGVLNGVYIEDTGSVANSGLIAGGALGNGVYLNRGGVVNNIGGGNGNDGLITGGYSGVQVGYQFDNPNLSATVTNSGIITGNTVAGVVVYTGQDANGLVTNLDGGTIGSGVSGYGVAMYGTNSAVDNSGVITVGRFGQGVRLVNGGVVTNYGDGSIRSGAKGDGVYLAAGGSVGNSGYIYGGFGVKSNGQPAYVLNSGYIKAVTVGVDMLQGGLVLNGAFCDCDIGSIYGRQVGVEISGAPGTVINAGYIGGGLTLGTGIGVLLNDGGTVTNEQAYYDGGLAGGSIVGATDGIAIKGQPGYVFNSGFIDGGTFGVTLSNGGLVENAAYTTTIGLNSYSRFGVIEGGSIGVAIGALTGSYALEGGVLNAGGIEGEQIGVALYNLETAGVSNAVTGTITGFEDYGVKLEDIFAGTVSNAGSIGGFGYGVKFKDMDYASLSNTGAGAEILGYFEDGVKFYDITNAYVGNSGTILGAEDGVHAYDLDNASIANEFGGTILGGNVDGVRLIDTTDSNVYNGGTIIGFEGGVAIGNGYRAFVTNAAAGTIIGYTGYGVGVYNVVNQSVSNAGTIIGDQTGVALDAFLAGTVVNQTGATIAGYNSFGVVMSNFDYNAYNSAVVTNAGAILGQTGGIDIYQGVIAGLVNENAGTIIGFDGDGADFTNLTYASVYNAGTIKGYDDGIDFRTVSNDVNITNVSTGQIYGYELDGVKVINAGIVNVSNAGVIFGDSDGLDISGNLSTAVINELGGRIIGATDNGLEFGPATYVSVYNAGSIFGLVDGVYAYDGLSASVTNAAPGVIDGAAYTAVDLEDGANFVDNSGLIESGEYADGVFENGTYAALMNAATGTIFAPDIGAALYATYNTLVNAGTIYSYEGDDVNPKHYDGVNVSGSISGVTNLATGEIYGSYNGIYSNSGTFMLSNAGTIGGYYNGVYSYEGSVTSVYNSPTGDILARYAGVEMDDNQDTLVNAGLISAVAGEGADVYNDDVVIDNVATGTIYGGQFGIEGEPFNLTLDNAGTVMGGVQDGLYLEYAQTASVLNEATGTIIGGEDGINSDAYTFALDNAGLIEGVEYDGVDVYETVANILNEATGTITGAYEGLYSDANDFALDNAGLINGDTYSGVLVNYAQTADILNGAGGTISGGTDGIWVEYLDSSFSNIATITNAGLITGGVDGVLVGYPNNTATSIGFITNSGVIEGGDIGVNLYGQGGGVVTNTGTIAGGNIGVYLNYENPSVTSFGTVLNSGLIAGGTYGVLLGYLTNTLGNIGTVMNLGGTITGGSIGVALDGLAGGVVTNTGTITGGAIGVAIMYQSPTYASLGTVMNGGVISGGSLGVAIGYASNTLQNPGFVTNSGTIFGGTTGLALYGLGAGTLLNTGVITGSLATGALLVAGGYVNNAGMITGGAQGLDLEAGGTVTNTGTIAGGSGDALDIAGDGTLDNSGALLGGADGVSIAGTGLVTNTGAITGGTGDGLALEGGGVTNSGLISGAADGIDTGDADIANTGTILGAAGDGVAMTAGTLTNAAGALIEGGTDGVIAGGGAVIVNAGTILDDAAPLHAGVKLVGTDSLTNDAGGTIAGAIGVLLTGDDDTFVNSGTVISTDGGDAIQINPGADPAQITLTSGSMETGAIDGGGTDGQITLVGTNTLPNDITNFGAGSALTIAPGADWTGSGNWTIALVDNTGTFQAGVLGTPLNLTGNFVQSAGGTLRVIVTPKVTTQFNVSGTATLAGNLTYEFAPGFYTPTKLTFLQAAGGVTTDDLKVSYLGAVPVILSHTTNNNVLVENGTLGSNLVLGYVQPEDISIYGDAAQTSIMDAQADNSSLLDKAAQGDQAGANAAACAAEQGEMPGTTPGNPLNTESHMAGAMGAAFCQMGGWISATGTESNIDNSNGAEGYDATEAGFLAGVDREFGGNGTRIGLAVGYDEAWLHDGAGGKASVDTTRVGLYGSQPLGRFTLAADFLYGHADNTTTRATGVGAAGAKYGNNDLDGGVQISTGMTLQGFNLEPSAGVRVALVDSDNFAETSAAELAPFAVTGHTRMYNSVQPYAQLGVNRGFLTASGLAVTPDAAVGFFYEDGNRSRASRAVTADGTQFSSGQVNADTGIAKLSAGITAGKNNWSLYARYSAYVSGNWTSQTGEAGLQVKF